MKAKNTILDLLLKVQNKETWVEDINDIIYGYSRAVMLCADSDSGSATSFEHEHLFHLKKFVSAFNEIDKFDEVLLSKISAKSYCKIISEITCNYSIAVIETMADNEHERTSTHLLILKDLGKAFYESIPN